MSAAGAWREVARQPRPASTPLGSKLAITPLAYSLPEDPAAGYRVQGIAYILPEDPAVPAKSASAAPHGRRAHAPSRWRRPTPRRPPTPMPRNPTPRRALQPCTGPCRARRSTRPQRSRGSPRCASRQMRSPRVSPRCHITNRRIASNSSTRTGQQPRHLRVPSTTPVHTRTGSSEVATLRRRVRSPLIAAFARATVARQSETVSTASGAL